MAKNVNKSPWEFDATGQQEGFESSPGYNTYGTFTAATSDIVTMTEHGLGKAGAVGGPVQVSSSGTLPAGLSASTDYWFRVIDRDTFYLYDDEETAQDNGTAEDITSTGSGTHTLSMKNVFQFPFYVSQIKLDTGDGGDFLITGSSDAQDHVLKLDSTPANDTLWIQEDRYWEYMYIQTLASNAKLFVYVGEPMRR